MWVIGLVVLLIGLVVSVALHELGHLLPAKKFGALVPEYWVGFGPTLWKTKKGQTTYGLKAILLGGYVRIVGMFAPPRPGVKTTNRRGQTTLAQQAREQSLLDIEEASAAGMQGVPFYQLSAAKKLTIMLGGPLMNLLISVVLIAVILLGFGWQSPSTTIETVVPSEDSSSSGAAAAGIEAGDRITEWGGQSVTSWDQLRALIQQTPPEGTEVSVVTADGTPQTLTVIPNIDAEGTRSIGIVSQIQRERGSLGDVGRVVWNQFAQTGQAIIALPVGLYNLVKSMITGEERDPGGVVSLVGVARIAGEITSPDAMGTTTQTASGTVSIAPSFEDRVVMMLSLLAALNMALFVFNLIPLPPLDGGHVAGALYGAAKNGVARLRGKPKPPPVDTARMTPLTYGVFGALMVMTLILVVADVVKPLSIA